MDRGFVWLNRGDDYDGAQVELKVGILLACYQLFWATATLLVKNGVCYLIRGFYLLIRCYLVAYSYY